MASMGRGRKATVTDTQILLEILLNRDRAVFAGEIAAELPVTSERVRQLLDDLEDEGYVTISKVSSRNIYRLTRAGHDHLASELRAAIQSYSGK